MYRWIVFVHVLGVFVFLLAHGVATFVAFRLRGEHEVERLRVLLDLSRGTRVAGSVSMLITLAAGIAVGFMGNWWGQLWIWAALVTLILMAVAMNVLGTRSLNGVRDLVQANGSPSRAKKHTLPSPDISLDQQITKTLATIHPRLLTVIGVGGLALILWLMMFKPF